MAGRGLPEILVVRQEVEAAVGSEPDVEQHDVGLDRGEERTRLFQGPGGAGDRDARLRGEDRRRALADHRVIVDDHHPDRGVPGPCLSPGSVTGRATRAARGSRPRAIAARRGSPRSLRPAAAC